MTDSGEVLWRGAPSTPSRARHARGSDLSPSATGSRRGTVEACLREPFGFAVHRQRSWNREWAANWLSSKLGRDPGFLDQETRLSGGETQIVALLRAIQLEPAVLLLDEPTSALDADTTHGLEQLVRQWFEAAPDRRAYVWVTRDPAQATPNRRSYLGDEAGTAGSPTHE
ncbi:MAG: ATP-binding cassette domain-containing protein [Pirellulaceae bacterium]